VPACQYLKNGFNETFSFLTDIKGNINGFSYEIIDYKYLASLEKSAKKKRLLTTIQFEIVDTKAIITPTYEGTRPIFTKVKYNSLGGEVKE
jgi:hypothetical protein